MIQLKVYKDPTRLQQYWLDLYDSEPIKLTLSIEDITNADATSTYSKAFKVPGTRKNNEFFQQAFEINGVLFDVTVKKPATILVDGAEFRQGHVRLNKMIKNTELDRYDYELVFLGETRDFSSIIGDSQLCQLNMPDLIGGPSGSPLNREDVVNSWQAFPQMASLTAGLHNGDIIYPLADHGNTYADTGMPLQSEVRTNSGPLAKPFNSVTHPLALNQMKPMIRAKRIWDQIFDNAGYTYTSSFIDSARFHQMYVSAFGNVSEPAYDAASASEYNFSASELPSAGNEQGAGVQFANDVEVDPSNAWNGFQYVAPATGSYTFTGSTYFWGYDEIQSSWPPSFNQVYGVLQVQVNGVAVATGSYASNSTSNVTWTGNLSTGDIVTFFLNAPDNVTFIAAINQSFACTNSPGNINPASLLECTYKQIDFIKDILLMFRLVLSPDANNPRNFIVEPWQTYINSGQLYDWSGKLVEEKDVIVEPVFFTQSDQITFTQPTDGDYINLYQMQSYKHNWGWLQFDSGNDLLKGSREIKVTGIANTPFTQIEGQTSTSAWIVPQLHTHGTDDGPTRHLPIKPKTRLMFYNGLKATPEPWYMVDTSPLNNYPLVSQYEAWPITPASLNLGFSNDIQYWGDDITSANYNLNGTTLYDSYWSRYINSLYNKYSRRVTAYFVLNNIDLNTFSFDDTIFVNGVYYIPEKIIDVQIGAYTEVQVQLLTANDFVPTWSNETLFATAEGVNTDCLGSTGQINVESGGAGPINWSLSNGQSGQFNNYSPPPYSFSIPFVPPGSYTLTLTDVLGRTVILPITVPLGTSPTATHVVTNATPGLCNGTIDVTPIGTGPFTIFWSDQYPLAGTFARTNLCCGPYSYFVRDVNGCSSPAYLVQVECPPPTFIYEAHEYGKSCNTLSGTEVIVQCAAPCIIGGTDVYILDTIPGCFALVATSTLPPVANIVAVSPSCEVCKNPDPIEIHKDWYFFSHQPGIALNWIPNASIQSSADKLLTDGIRDYYMPLVPQPVPAQILDEVSTTQNLSTAFQYLLDTVGYVMPGTQTFLWPGQLNGFNWSNPEIASPEVRLDNGTIGMRYYVAVKNSIFNDFFEYNAVTERWIGPKMWTYADDVQFSGGNSGSYLASKSFTLGGVAYTLLLSESTTTLSTSYYGVDPLCYLQFAGPTPTPTPGPTATSWKVQSCTFPVPPIIPDNSTRWIYKDQVALSPGDIIKSEPADEFGPCYTVVELSYVEPPNMLFSGVVYDTCEQCSGPVPTPTPLPITTYFYEVQSCAGGPIEIIQSDFELSFGDVYGFAELDGCWTIVGETSPPVGTYPIPNVSYINCSVCYGEPAGIFKTNKKPRGGYPETVCDFSHPISIYNGDVTDAADLQIGMTMWSDASQSIPWNGASLWYSIANAATPGNPEVSVLINSVGMIKDISMCGSATCFSYTQGGYDIGSCTYIDCSGNMQGASYCGPCASGFDATTFCAIEIIEWSGSEPVQSNEIC